MPLENYTFADICTLLMAFNLPDRPYKTSLKNSTDIYCKVISSPSDINLLTDTFEYLREVQKRKAIPTDNRRVAFLFNNKQGNFAIIIHYQLIKKENWRLNLDELPNAPQSTITQALNRIYQQICIDCIAPKGYENYLLPFLSQLKFSSAQHIITELSGVSFTESILLLLFRGMLVTIPLEQAAENHWKKCREQLSQCLADLERSNQGQYNEVKNLLTLIIKLSLLQPQQLRLLDSSNAINLSSTNEQLKRHFFTLSFNTISDIASHLSLKDILQLLHRWHDIPELITQLRAQRAHQEEVIVKLDEEIKQKQEQALQQWTWKTWGQQSLHSIVSYCYQRSHLNLGIILTPWLATEIIPARMISYLNSLMIQLGSLINKLHDLLPEHRRPIHHTKTDTLSSFFQFLGSGLGLAYMYYLGMFEVMVSLSLLFLTEQSHHFLAHQKTDVHNARVIPRFKAVPSLNALLQLNMILLMMCMSLYTEDAHPLKRGVSAIIVSQLFQWLFNKLTPSLALPAEDQTNFKFLISQLSLYWGSSLFTIYDNLVIKMIAQENTLKKLTELASEANIKPQDWHTEFPNLLEKPWLAFSDHKPFTFFWHEPPYHYKANCEILSNQNGTAGTVNCEMPYILHKTPMLMKN